MILDRHTSLIVQGVAVSAVSSSPTLSVVDDSDPLLGELADVPPAPDGLLELLERVPDPRNPRGVRHALAPVLAVALAAGSLGRARSWRSPNGPPTLRRRCWRGSGDRRGAVGVDDPPLPATLAPDKLDELIGAWMWLRTSMISGRRVIAFDGKTLRGARDAAGNLVHLLAGLCQHTGTVLAQLAVGAKTNEIPLLTKLLETIDITGAIITADALHCQRDTAESIVEPAATTSSPSRTTSPRCADSSKTFRGNRSRSPTAASSTATAAPPNACSKPPRSTAASASRTRCRCCN